MKFLTAGESHGRCLVGIMEGVPSNLTLDVAALNRELARRQLGYGRGARMAIEKDTLELVAGVRNSVTTGAPIAFCIENKDYANWAPYMDCVACDTQERQVREPRPGHADYVGAKKYGFTDARNVLERASARNTATIVAVGGIAKQFLARLGIRMESYVTRIGTAVDTTPYGSLERIQKIADVSPVRAVNARVELDMITNIDAAKRDSDTVGGAFRVVVTGVKAGIGSCMAFDRKVDGNIASALGGMQGIKAVSFGDGEAYGEAFGTHIHDAMYPSQAGVTRETNHAGGIEGGMTNGEDIVVNAVFKPIPTTMKGLPSVDLVTGEAVTSSRERSDICAVPAAACVGEAFVAIALMQEILVDIGGNNMEEIISRWNA